MLDVDDVVYLLLEPGHDAGEGAVDLLGLLGRAADDERRARLVDQDRVDLVDNGIRMRRVFALHRLRQVLDHVVAQVVEAELVIGAVRDIGAISLATGGGPKVAEARVLEVRGRVVYIGGIVLKDADREAEAVEDRPHPLRVALGKVVVYGDEVSALAGESVEIKRKRGDKRLSFTGLHLGDLAFVKDDPAQDLHVEVAQADAALRDLPDGRERFRQDVVERLAGGQSFAKLR